MIDSTIPALPSHRPRRPRPTAADRRAAATEWLNGPAREIVDGHDESSPYGALTDHGLKAWQQVLERGYEGLVAKDETSLYVGGRTLKWLKVKQRDYRVEERGWDSRNKS